MELCPYCRHALSRHTAQEKADCKASLRSMQRVLRRRKNRNKTKSSINKIDGTGGRKFWGL